MQFIKAKDIDFYYVTTLEGVEKLANIISGVGICALDTEVYSLFEKYGDKASWRDPHTSTIRTLQLNIVGNKTPWVVDVMKVGVEGCKPLIKQLMRPDLIKVLHHARFDLKVIKSTFDVWLPNCLCTMVMMQRLGLCVGFKSSQMRGHSLKALGRDFFDITLSKVEQASEWYLPDLRPSQLEYAALDVGAPKSKQVEGMYSIVLEGYFMLKEVLETEPPYGYGVKIPLDLDLRANQAIAKMEYRGMPVNKALIQIMMDTARKEMELRKMQLCKDLGLKVNQTVVMTSQGPKRELIIPDHISKMLNNPKALTVKINERLRAVLGTELTDVQSGTLEATLKKLKSEVTGEDEELEDDEDDFFQEEVSFNIALVDNVLEYKRLVKMLGTDYISLINPVTGCLHSLMGVIGAATGRMSSGGTGSFNCQQLSKEEMIIPKLEKPYKTNSLVLY